MEAESGLQSTEAGIGASQTSQQQDSRQKVEAQCQAQVQSLAEKEEKAEQEDSSNQDSRGSRESRGRGVRVEWCHRQSCWRDSKGSLARLGRDSGESKGQPAPLPDTEQGQPVDLQGRSRMPFAAKDSQADNGSTAAQGCSQAVFAGRLDAASGSLPVRPAGDR